MARSISSREVSLAEVVTSASAVVTSILDRDDDPDEATQEYAAKLLTAAVRLYSRLGQRSAAGVLSVDPEVTVTEAADVAAVLLLSQGLSVFEFNGWYARVAQLVTSRDAGIPRGKVGGR